MAERIDVLIAAAHPVELAGLRALLGSELAGDVRGLHVATCDVGVGLPAASVGATCRLREQRPRALILLGSCGVYPEAAARALLASQAAPAIDAPSIQAPLLRVAIPDRVLLADAGVAQAQAAFPQPMPRAVVMNGVLVAGLAVFAEGALRGALATTLGITTSNLLAERLERESGCETENLEALGVGLACAAEQVAFAAVLPITNLVGEQGRSQWLAHHALAAERGARVITQWLENGAPGLPSS